MTEYFTRHVNKILFHLDNVRNYQIFNYKIFNFDLKIKIVLK